LIYKYVGAGSPEEIVQILKYFIEDGSIKASSPRTFNDPSEFKVEYDFEASDETIKQRYFLDNPESNEEKFKQWLNSFTPQSKQHIGYTNRHAMLNAVGVVCLTPDPNNYVMWSHYSNDHTGFCIGFDEEIITSLDNTLFFSEVKYQNEIPIFKYFYETREDYIRALFFTKSKSWKYEKEFRAITEGHGIRTFNRSLIKEVIIGCRAPRELEEYARSRLGSDIDFLKMVDHPKEYGLIKQAIIEGTYVESSAF
jgi:hypothetical protein